jgi:plasmid stabilization system protein ParE
VIRYTKRALADLLAIGDFIAAENPVAAADWVARLRNRVERAADMPRSGRVVPELEREHIREVFVRTYRLIYRVEEGGITVLAALEGRKQLGDIDDV